VTLDPSIPFRAGQAATVNLAELYAQAQQMKLQQRGMDMREQEFSAAQEQREREAQEGQLARQREQAGMVARLTRGVTDEATYQQRIAAARQYGLDTSEAPPQFDPEWVQTQNILAETFFREGPDKLTTTAQELVEAGLEPGTPQFQRAMAQRIAMQDSKVVNTTAGGMSGMLGPNGYQPFILPNSGEAPAGAPVSGGVQEGATATNPQTGEKVIFKGGQWVPLGGGGGNATGGFQP
jgi:hypothetical protein